MRSLFPNEQKRLRKPRKSTAAEQKCVRKCGQMSKRAQTLTMTPTIRTPLVKASDADGEIDATSYVVDRMWKLRATMITAFGFSSPQKATKNHQMILETCKTHLKRSRELQMSVKTTGQACCSEPVVFMQAEVCHLSSTETCWLS